MALLFSAVTFAGCARNYVTHHHEVHVISEKTEIQIGQKAKEGIIKEYGIYKDIKWETYVDQVGQRLAKVSDRPNLQYDFTIIDSDEMNAFAVPGGFIFITRGLLSQMVDEAELAIVLGHEITHVAAWHAIQTLQRSAALSTLTALGTIGGIVAGAGEASLALAQAAGIYENLYLIGYGRDHELQADEYGIIYAAKAGYDSSAALTFFRRLETIEQEEMAGQHISPYWIDHPPTKDRLKLSNQWIAEAPKPANGGIYNRDKFLAYVSRLPRNHAKDKGVVQGTHYANSFSRLSLDVPHGWTIENNTIQYLVGFVGPVQDVRGKLQQFPLTEQVGIQEFSKQISKQWNVQVDTQREVDYPAGHGIMWQYGDDIRYRTLLLIRGQTGYALQCQIPSDHYFDYLFDCESIMRSFRFD
jgi:predicted Zn-dependent protease